MKRIIKCFDLKNIIKEPTRISGTAKTLIDLIIFSDPDKIERSGSIEPAISDHKLIFCVLQIKNVSSKPVIKEVRTKRAFDEEKFIKQLNEAPWWIMEVFDDIDDMVFTWESMNKDILREFIKTRKAKVKSHSLPWINREIKKLMNRRYKALQLWQKSRHNNDLREEYKRLKNLVNRKLKAAEADY